MKITTSGDTTKVVAIIVNLFFPGLGNIIYKQTSFGVPVLIGSLLLTVFYFLPLIPLFNIMNLPVDQTDMLLMITVVLACGAWIVDLILMVVSIVKITKE